MERDVRRPARARRVALAGAATLLALVAVEAGFFLFGPEIESYAKPTFRDAAGEPLADLYDVILFLGGDSDWERVPPATRLKPGARFRMCYDRPAWDYFDADGCVDVALNRFGFRDDDFALEKPPGQHRVLCLGDSITFGLGVPQNGTWPQLLERRLAETRGDGVQVVNGGWAWNYDPASYAEWLPTEGLAFQPDTVVVGLCLNDVWRHVPMVAQLPAPERPYLGGDRRTPFVVLRRWWEQRRVDAEPRGDYADVLRRVPEAAADWEATSAGLAAMQGACDAAGVRFLVAILPMMSDLSRDYPFRTLHELVAGFCAEHGIEHVDLLGRFLGLEDTSLWVHATDQHPNVEGQRRIAAGVHAALAGGG